MLSFSILVVSVISTLAANRCEVGEWGAWSDWSKPGCTGQAEVSYRADEPSVPGKGAEAREYMMKKKDENYKQLVQNRLENPDIMPQSVGAVPCINGSADGYPCRNIDQVAFFDFQDLCGEYCGEPIPQMTSCDSWGWTDPQDGTEYAIHTMNAGTSFVRLNADVTVLPTVIAYMDGPGSFVREWRDAKVIGNFVYIGSETYDHGLQVFDLRNLRGLTELVEVFPDATYYGFGQSHNIVASESSNTIFAVGCTRQPDIYETCNGGLHAVDVSDPTQPSFAGCFSTDGYTHDAQCVLYNGPDPNYQGSEICFAFNEDSLTIVDVTNKANMVQVSRTEYTNNQYTHQGWATEDLTMLLLDDELDEYYGTTPMEKIQRTHIWNIEDLTRPVLVETWMSANRVIDHNQYIINNTVYQSNYEVGLRILHLDRATPALDEVAYFDVHIPDSVVNFYGMWNAYPYFASNQIVCSVIETGLFILRPDQVAINKLIVAGETFTERARYRSILSADQASYCPNLVEVEQKSVPSNMC